MLEEIRKKLKETGKNWKKLKKLQKLENHLIEQTEERDNSINRFEALFKEFQGIYGNALQETPPTPPKAKKSFKGIVGGLLEKKGKHGHASTSSGGTTVRSHNKLDMYQGVPCDYDENDVDFDALAWWKQTNTCSHISECQSDKFYLSRYQLQLWKENSVLTTIF